MNKIPVNPWTWQDQRGFTQAWRVEAPSTILFLSGQVPLDDNGNVVAPGGCSARPAARTPTS